MATIVSAGALSHSPLMNLPIPGDHELVNGFRSATAELGRRIRESKPDVVVVFGPDHFRSLFYDMMPAFVIGVGRLDGWGDWNTSAGPFRVQPDLARHVLNHLLNHGFDPAFSYDLKVDHGIVQPLQLLDLEALPILPVMINSAGPPLPSLARCHAFGSAVAQAIAAFPNDLRVAVIGSGGLSHDPPTPSPESDDPEVVRRAVHGKASGFAASRERETALVKNAGTLKARISPGWDRKVIDHFVSGHAALLASQLTSESIQAEAGSGGQEIRNWVAVAGAIGDRPMQELFYEPIGALMTGMGVVGLKPDP